MARRNALLPYELADAKEGLLGCRLAWLGFALAASIALVNGLSFLYPSIPSIPIYRRSIAYLITEKPLSAMQEGRFNASFYPFALGLSFLMPLDLAFSSWFFYLLGKLEFVIGSMAGWTSSPGFPNNW